MAMFNYAASRLSMSVYNILLIETPDLNLETERLLEGFIENFSQTPQQKYNLEICGSTYHYIKSKLRITRINMPTSGFDLYHMQDAKNNFDAMRPAPVCTETNQFMGQCHNIHVSTNCYYGYHGAKWTTAKNSQNEADCEMLEMPTSTLPNEKVSIQKNARKRSADDETYPQHKRLKEEVQRKRNIKPETNENLGLDANAQELLENLYWHLHGGTFFICYSD